MLVSVVKAQCPLGSQYAIFLLLVILDDDDDDDEAVPTSRPEK